jgi:hypothetical protein
MTDSQQDNQQVSNELDQQEKSAGMGFLAAGLRLAGFFFFVMPLESHRPPDYSSGSNFQTETLPNI